MTASDPFAAWIGRRDALEPDLITPRLTNEFTATFGAALADGPTVPPGLHWCLSPQIVEGAKLGADGHPLKGGFLPPVPLPRRMWAGGDLRFPDPLRPGDYVKKTSTIEGIERKTGKSGELCFVAVKHVCATERGAAVVEHQDIVYRAAATGPDPGPTPPETQPEFEVEATVEISTTMLFRYSAMTFNGHRIHYDQDYARTQEFYPDLVIQGPLQATLLLNFAARQGLGMPSRFSFRGTAPATGAQVMRLGATCEGNSCELAALSEQGVITMTAKAHWN